MNSLFPKLTGGRLCRRKKAHAVKFRSGLHGRTCKHIDRQRGFSYSHEVSDMGW